MSDLQIVVDDVELTASWVDANPTTRAAIEEALPLSGDASRWGDELYFGTGIDVALEDGQSEVPVGAIAFWPQGNAVCLFWGPTPASRGEEPRAASPVNLLAQIDDVEPLHSIEGRASVEIQRIED